MGPRMAAPIGLQPTAELAERVLLPGDPARALRLAESLLEGPKMFNHHRGLWGYSGVASDGVPLTIQSTGMGGPSAAIVVHELVELGARLLLRVGTCGALRPGPPSARGGALARGGATLPTPGPGGRVGQAGPPGPRGGPRAAPAAPRSPPAAFRSRWPPPAARSAARAGPIRPRSSPSAA